MAEPEFDLFAEMDSMCHEDAPRRFALCLIRPDGGDAMVVGWGLQLADENYALLSHYNRSLSIHASAEGALNSRLWGPRKRHLVWLDPEPES